MKKKRPGQRAAAKKRGADEIMLRRFARLEYNKARRRIAERSGLPINRIGNRDGHSKAQLAGYTRLREWFDQLGETRKALARRDMRKAIEEGLDAPPSEMANQRVETKKIEGAPRDAIVVINDHKTGPERERLIGLTKREDGEDDGVGEETSGDAPAP